MSFCCPTCGRAATEMPIEAIADMPLPNVLRTVANALVKAYPEPVSADALIDAIYGNRQPATARLALRVQLSRLRDKIALCGWTVSKALHGRGIKGEYRLELRQNNHV
ncbi:MAG: helix-turn-helix domain-containing protein [Mesorhizobium sp.]|nr:MAG: helix-turn-helix domain-containing protein [Mesorhizobium sp.]